MTDKQRKWVLVAVASGVLTAPIFAMVDFSPGTSVFMQVFMIVFAWAFIACGIWLFVDGFSALIGLPQNLKERRKASERAKRHRAQAAQFPATASAIHPASATAVPDDLSPEDKAHMAAWLNSFVKAGIIDGAQFDDAARDAVQQSVAGWGEASPFAILMGIEELGEGQMRAGGLLPTLGFLDSKGEQLAEGIVDDVAMLERVTDGALALGIDRITVPPYAAMADSDIELDLRISGSVVPLRWRSAAKYASTILPVYIARAYHALGRDDALATLWSDQGSFILRLTPAQYRSFNARMSRQECGDDRFGWLHRETPFASGDPLPA